MLLVLQLFVSLGFLARIEAICPHESYSQNKTEVFEEVRESIEEVFAASLNGTRISSDFDMYKAIAKVLNKTTSSDGFVYYTAAITEIAVAKIQYCNNSGGLASSDTELSRLIEKFNDMVKNKTDVHEARVIYGKILCLLRKHRERRLIPSTVEPSSLGGMLFFYPYDFKASLAFVVDDTGSMSEEIEAVRNIIHSFIKTEQDYPHYYILGTFNDPVSGTYVYKYDVLNTYQSMSNKVSQFIHILLCFQKTGQQKDTNQILNMR